MIDISRILINAPEDIDDDIRRNLTMLYSIKEGEQPLDRELGINTDFMSLPLPVAKNQFSVEIIRKTELYEPRVEIQDISFDETDEDGTVRPIISLIKREDEESDE